MKSTTTKNADESFFKMAEEEAKRIADEKIANRVIMDRNRDYLKHYD